MKNNPEIKTAGDKARQKAANFGLIYDDISSKDFFKLVEILRKELVDFASEGGLEMSITEKPKRDSVQFNMKLDGSLKSAYIKVSSYYFDGREAISFNQNEWVGFAGWADSTNVQPFANAFEKWVELLGSGVRSENH